MFFFVLIYFHCISVRIRIKISTRCLPAMVRMPTKNVGWAYVRHCLQFWQGRWPVAWNRRPSTWKFVHSHLLPLSPAHNRMMWDNNLVAHLETLWTFISVTSCLLKKFEFTNEWGRIFEIIKCSAHLAFYGMLETNQEEGEGRQGAGQNSSGARIA